MDYNNQDCQTSMGSIFLGHMVPTRLSLLQQNHLALALFPVLHSLEQSKGFLRLSKKVSISPARTLAACKAICPAGAWARAWHSGAPGVQCGPALN